MSNAQDKATRAVLERIGFKECTPGKVLLFKKRVGSGYVYVDIRSSRVFHKIYHVGVRIPDEQAVLCKELVMMNRSGISYPLHAVSGSQPIALQVIAHRKIDGICQGCQEDIISDIPWTDLGNFEHDALRERLSYCQSCIERRKQEEIEAERRRNAAWEAHEQAAIENREHARRMSELNRAAELEEHKTLDERGFDMDG